MKKILSIMLIGLLVLSCGKKEEDVIKIGAILPLTGPVAIFGQWTQNGIKLAIDEYKLGNPKTENISIFFEDSKLDAKYGISAYNKLVTNDHVDVIISSMSKVSIPILEIDNRETTVLLQDVTYPNISQKYKNVIRHFIQSDREAEILSEFALDSLKLKTCGILYVNDEAGVGAKDAFSKTFNRLGRVTIIESFESVSQDVKVQVSKINSNNPECVFVFGNGPSWAIAMRTFKEQNYKGIILTNTALYIPNFRKMAGEAAEGVYFTYPYMDTLDVSTKRFITMYQKKYNEFPSLESAYGYDLIKLIIAASKNEDLTFNKRLNKLKTFSGAFGKLIIDKTKDIKTKVALARFTGQIKNIKIIN